MTVYYDGCIFWNRIEKVQVKLINRKSTLYWVRAKKRSKIHFVCMVYVLAFAISQNKRESVYAVACIRVILIRPQCWYSSKSDFSYLSSLVHYSVQYVEITKYASICLFPDMFTESTFLSINSSHSNFNLVWLFFCWLFLQNHENVDFHSK